MEVKKPDGIGYAAAQPIGQYLMKRGLKPAAKPLIACYSEFTPGMSIKAV